MTGWSRWFSPVPVVLAFLGLGAALTVFLVYGTWVREADEVRPVQHLATRIDDAIFTNRQADLQALAGPEEIIRVATGGWRRRTTPRSAWCWRPPGASSTRTWSTSWTRPGGWSPAPSTRATRPSPATATPSGPTSSRRSTASRRSIRPWASPTRLRGLYFSSPIDLGDRDIVGVLVVKARLDGIDRILAGSPEPAFLVSPDGVIFASNQKEMLFHYVKPMGPDWSWSASRPASSSATRSCGPSRTCSRAAFRPLQPRAVVRLQAPHPGRTGRWWRCPGRAPLRRQQGHLVFAAAGALGAVTLIIAVPDVHPRGPRPGEEARLEQREELKTYQGQPGRAGGAQDRRAAGGEGSGRERHRGQEHLPGQHEPRAAHAPERHPGLRPAPRPGSGGPGNRDNLQRIHRAGEHLLDLINHVLSLSKIEAGKLALDRQPFSTERFFKSIEDLTRIRAAAKGLEFRLEVRRPFPQALLGDALKLRQVLVNILGNAIQFTRQGSVSLRGGADREPGALHGPGHRAGHGPRGTGRALPGFPPGPVRLEAGEGAGLGLHISQSMVRLMGGLIQVESEPGRGSAFSFEIPMAEGRVQVEGRAAGAGPGPDQPPLRMLVVDDVEDNRTLLARMLSAMGMEVREAQDGESALALVETWQPRPGCGWTCACRAWTATRPCAGSGTARRNWAGPARW